MLLADGPKGSGIGTRLFGKALPKHALSLAFRPPVAPSVDLESDENPQDDDRDLDKDRPPIGRANAVGATRENCAARERLVGVLQGERRTRNSLNRRLK